MCKSIRYSVVTERVKSILFRIWNFSSQRLICRMYFLCSPQSVSARKYFAANSQCKYFTGTRSHGRLPTIIGAFYHEFLLQTLLSSAWPAGAPGLFTEWSVLRVSQGCVLMYPDNIDTMHHVDTWPTVCINCWLIITQILINIPLKDVWKIVWTTQGFQRHLLLFT